MVRPPTEKNICLRCKGARLLCGKKTCPILLKKSILKSMIPFEIGKTIRNIEIFGASPPGFFVGRYSKTQWRRRTVPIPHRWLLPLVYARKCNWHPTFDWCRHNNGFWWMYPRWCWLQLCQKFARVNPTMAGTVFYSV